MEEGGGQEEQGRRVSGPIRVSSRTSSRSLRFSSCAFRSASISAAFLAHSSASALALSSSSSRACSSASRRACNGRAGAGGVTVGRGGAMWCSEPAVLAGKEGAMRCWWRKGGDGGCMVAKGHSRPASLAAAAAASSAA